MNGGTYFDGLFPPNPQDAMLRKLQGSTLPDADPYMPLAWEGQIELDQRMGVEAWDYQNPYIWQSSLYFANKQDLNPAYGTRGDTGESIIANIGRTNMLLMKGSG